MAPQRAEVVFFFYACVLLPHSGKGPRSSFVYVFTSNFIDAFFFFFLGGGELFWLFAYSSPCSWR